MGFPVFSDRTEFFWGSWLIRVYRGRGEMMGVD